MNVKARNSGFKLHTHLMGLEPTTSAFALHLQGEKVPFELELIGQNVILCGTFYDLELNVKAWQFNWSQMAGITLIWLSSVECIWSFQSYHLSRGVEICRIFCMLVKEYIHFFLQVIIVSNLLLLLDFDWSLPFFFGGWGGGDWERDKEKHKEPIKIQRY